MRRCAKKEMSLAEIHFTLKRLKADQENRQSQMEKSEAEGKNLGSVILDLETKVKESKEKVLENQNKSLEVTREWDKVSEALKQKMGGVEAEERQLHEWERKARAALEELRKIEQQLLLLDVKEKDSEKQLARLQEDIRNSGTKQKELEEHELFLQEQKQSLTVGLKGVEEHIRSLEDKVKGHEKEMSAKEQIIEEKRLKLKAEEELKYQLGIQKAQVESLLSSAEAELQMRYGLVACEVNIPLEAGAERKCQKLRVEIAAYRAGEHDGY